MNLTIQPCTRYTAQHIYHFRSIVHNYLIKSRRYKTFVMPLAFNLEKSLHQQKRTHNLQPNEPLNTLRPVCVFRTKCDAHIALMRATMTLLLSSQPLTKSRAMIWHLSSNGGKTTSVEWTGAIVTMMEGRPIFSIVIKVIWHSSKHSTNVHCNSRPLITTNLALSEVDYRIKKIKKKKNKRHMD